MTALTSKTEPATAGYTTLWGTTELGQQTVPRGNALGALSRLDSHLTPSY
ncbi:hypothetical protein ABMA10_18790 [Plantibacter sp. RU18]